MQEKHYKWFCRISQTNLIKKENKTFIYNFEEIYDKLCEKYSKVIYIIHDKKPKNIHAHFIIQNDSQIRKETLLNILPYGNCRQQRGTNLECYNYLLHKGIEGKEPYEENEFIMNFKDDLNNWLEEKKESENEYDNFISDSYNGLNDIELAKKYPKQFFRYSNKLDKIRETIQYEQSNIFRIVEVNYIYGESRTGKTYNTINECKQNNMSYYRVTDYQRDPFYAYNGEEIIIFDEFHSDFPLNCLLTYLEGYERTQLPSRYRNRYALYTKVFIISNIPLEKQYECAEPETKKALYNRIKTITYYTKESILIKDLTKNTVIKKENIFFIINIHP